MPITYRKTAKGLAEIQTRANKLTPRLRQALILVDGRRSDADLRALVLQEPDATLLALKDRGFIEIAIATALPAQGPGPATPERSAAPARPMLSLEQLRRDAVRVLTDELGPAAETAAIRIERTRTADELRSAIALAAQMLSNARGREAAEAYMARYAHL